MLREWGPLPFMVLQIATKSKKKKRAKKKKDVTSQPENRDDLGLVHGLSGR